MSKKVLDFTGTKISEVKQINPLFSTCKVRVLYTGQNRNMSNISKESVERALPTIIGVPIVGEFSNESTDFKGHGGAIDLDSYDFIHTTKPYGFVPESATFSWEEVKTRDGSIREYLTVDGCYLWTGRYPEAKTIIESGKGQSMEIEVNKGDWDYEMDSYNIEDFTFSALCVLGDEVEPAFEDANITSSFSMESDVFKIEYAKMMKDVKDTLLKDKEEDEEMLKKLLAKYSTTREALTEKGLKFSEISEDVLEATIAEALGVDVIQEDSEQEAEVEETQETEEVETEQVETEEADKADEEEVVAEEAEEVEEEVVADADETEEETEEEAEQAEEEVETEEVADAQEETVDVDALNQRITELEDEIETISRERDELEQFKLETQKEKHEVAVEQLFNSFQLTQEDVKDLDVHKFSLDEMEEKCYAIIGKKMAEKKNFSKNKGIKLPLNRLEDDESPKSHYGDLFEKYNK